MPNWTRNELEIQFHNISGDTKERKKSVKDFLKKVTTLEKYPDGTKRQILDFNKIVPPPKNMFRGNLSEEDRIRCEKKGIPNWYDWCNENWHTKWNSCSCDIEVDEEYYELITITFNTAWSPPIPVINKLKQMFPDLYISGNYVGEGNEFAGVF